MGQKIWFSGGKAFGQCAGCGKIVTLNKTLFGSLHLCRERREIHANWQHQAYQQQHMMEPQTAATAMEQTLRQLGL